MSESGISSGRGISIVITLVLIIIAGASAFAVFGERQKVLKKEGCNISRQNEKDILTIQSDVKHIKETTDKILEKMEGNK